MDTTQETITVKQHRRHLVAFATVAFDIVAPVVFLFQAVVATQEIIAGEPSPLRLAATVALGTFLAFRCARIMSSYKKP